MAIYKMTAQDYLNRASKSAKRAHRALVELNEAIDHKDLRGAVEHAKTYGIFRAQMSEEVHSSGVSSNEVYTWHGKTLYDLDAYYRATLDRLPAMTKRANGRVAAGQTSGRKKRRP